MKKHQQLLGATFAIALASIARSADAPSPEEIAKAKVNKEIFAKIAPPVQRFSRAMPVLMYPTVFQPQIFVKGETRLPFSIQKISTFTKETFPVIVKGYIRLGDQEIYLHDAKTGTDVPAAKHPLFAPEKKTISPPSTPG